MLREWTIKKMLECMKNYGVTNSAYNTDYAFSHLTRCEELENTDAVAWIKQYSREISQFMEDFLSPFDPATRPIEYMESFYIEYGCSIFREITSDLPLRITIDNGMKSTIINRLKSLLATQK